MMLVVPTSLVLRFLNYKLTRINVYSIYFVLFLGNGLNIYQ